MLRIGSVFILSVFLICPPVQAGFYVYKGNLKVFEQDIGIEPGRHQISSEQCLRARYGRVDGPWPCTVDHRYIQGNVKSRHLYIYTVPGKKKLYSPGFTELLNKRP